MPNDDTSLSTPATSADYANNKSAQPVASSRSWSDIFSLPPPVKRIFDQYPLVVYEANELPLRTPRDREQHTLHVFTTDQDARAGRPSFNPGCLRWQAYLRFNSISFTVTPSNNHASPSGSLPFLLPAVSGQDVYLKTQEPVASNKLNKWIANQASKEKQTQEPDDIRYEAYASLVDNRIRKAWLYQLYINPANSALLHRLYIAPCSTNVFVQYAIAYQLRHAAETELTRSSASDAIVEDEIMRDAEEAISALSELLGDDEWFFALANPGMLDASVFAYTHLLLDMGLGWAENRLGQSLMRYGNLARHQQRIAEVYF